MKNLSLIGSYFIVTPLLIFACIFYLSILDFQKNKQSLRSNDLKAVLAPSKVAYAALPSTQNLLKDQIKSEDARIEIVSNFLQKHNPELLPFVQNVIDSADKYNLDFRLVPAIGMQESNLCKKAPKDSYNCWGYEIYGNKTKKFKSFPSAIEAVSQTLSEDYIKIGLVTPEQIMKKYTPGSNGSWAKGVSHFMNQLAIY